MSIFDNIDVTKDLGTEYALTRFAVNVMEQAERNAIALDPVPPELELIYATARNWARRLLGAAP